MSSQDQQRRGTGPAPRNGAVAFQKMQRGAPATCARAPVPCPAFRSRHLSLLETSKCTGITGFPRTDRVLRSDKPWIQSPSRQVRSGLSNPPVNPRGLSFEKPHPKAIVASAMQMLPSQPCYVALRSSLTIGERSDICRRGLLVQTICGPSLDRQSLWARRSSVAGSRSD